MWRSGDGESGMRERTLRRSVQASHGGRGGNRVQRLRRGVNLVLGICLVWLCQRLEVNFCNA